MKNSKPVIGVVQGDPGGIGSELLVKLLLDEEVRDRANIAVIGAPAVFERGESIVGKSIPRSHVSEFNNNFSRESAQHIDLDVAGICLLYTSPSPRDRQKSRMPSSA